MDILETPLKDCYILKPQVHKDERGFFFEQYNQRALKELIKQDFSFKQDNISSSQYGAIRGLHAQAGEHAQTKIVTVLQGEVLDVVADIRLNSPTYGQSFSVVLTAENHKQLLIPKGFVHGFSTLSPTALFFYKCDNFYHKSSEIGVRYDDPQLNIDWKIPTEKQIVSSKDLSLPLLKDLKI